MQYELSLNIVLNYLLKANICKLLRLLRWR
jgi:hypothetical protein